MTRRLIGAIASLLAMMAGLWLVLSPFALGFQEKDQDWTDATLTDVWTGLPLALVGLVGVIVFAVAISTHMVQAGYITPRPAPAPTGAPGAQQSAQAGQAAPAAASDRSREMDAMLEPLIAALARDIEREDSAATGSAPAAHAPETTHHREYGRSAVGTDTGAQAAVAADR
jgi:hypothetical protein